MDPNAKQSIIDRISQANNVLVTVKSSPSVDSLAACIGFTLFLNKMGKHATAVFSGAIPSTIEFLKPEETIEKNTDSLRDFIIALDKSKADKLRYKVEDEVVKIFITPYRTSLSDKDLDFSQGDFNVDVVVAIGVHAKEDLDQAIIAHGRILHDATVISINNGPGGSLGTLHLEDPAASSLCEVMVGISEGLHGDSFDAQMATAFLTGIVAETERFSNKKTSPQTMTMSAKLMSAGANQQLIATKLQPNMVASKKLSQEKPGESETVDGTLNIEHEEDEQVEDAIETELPAPASSVELPELPSVTSENNDSATGTDAPFSLSDSIKDVKSESSSRDNTPAAPAPAPTLSSTTRFASPPTMGGTLTANTQAQNYEPSTDPLSQPNAPTGQTLSHAPKTLDAPTRQELEDDTLNQIEKAVDSPHPREDSTLKDWEQALDSPHLDTPANAPTPDVDAARQAVEAAEAAATNVPPQAEQRSGASFLDSGVQDQLPPAPAPVAPMPTDPPASATPPAMPATPMPTPSMPPASPLPTTDNSALPAFLSNNTVPDATAASGLPTPPPVPPPLVPPNPTQPTNPGPTPPFPPTQ